MWNTTWLLVPPRAQRLCEIWQRDADGGQHHVELADGRGVADGNVRIESGEQIWVGEHIRYNFKTHQMQSEQFRTGKPPVFAAGNDLQGDTSNKTYTARHIFVTTDDVSKPEFRSVRAK